MSGTFYAVIPAGGSGTRLWPLSRANNPKFLHRFADDERSLLQATVDRVSSLASPEHTMIVTGAAHVEAVGKQLPMLPTENLVVEPVPRDSAPAIGLAAAIIAQRDPTAIMGSFAADHQVRDAGAFVEAVRTAIAAADQGHLVTIGLNPTRAETGYGYIQQGERRTDGVCAVRAFKEKPSATLAEQYLASGDYLWNASMFVWRVDVILAEIERQLPELHRGLRQIAADWSAPSQNETVARIWPTLPKISIDYAVMEKAAARGRVVTVPASIDWTDVGDWRTLGELTPAIEDGNAVINTDDNNGEVVLIDTNDSVIVPAAKRLVSLIGLNGVIVVDTPDALLVCARDRAQDVKKVMDRLSADDPHR